MISASRVLIAIALCVPLATANAGTPAPPPGAAACSGCHPAARGEFPDLGGHNAPDIVAAMKAFRSGARPATVMDRIAKGFSDDEISVIAEWYAAQK